MANYRHITGTQKKMDEITNQKTKQKKKYQEHITLGNGVLGNYYNY
jgi:hypothetical protein